MTTDPRIAVLAAISSPEWHPVPEAHGMPWDEAEALLDAYDASRSATGPSVPASCTTPCIACMTDESHDPAPTTAPNPAARAAAPSVPADADLRDRIAQALLTTRRTDYEGTADHRRHRYDARCALCAYDVDALADAVLAVLPAPADQAAEGIDWKAKYEAEHARHVAVVGQLVADPAAVLRGAADDWTAHCPNHADAEEAFMDCPCDWAAELHRKADELEAQQAGEQQ